MSTRKLCGIAFCLSMYDFALDYGLGTSTSCFFEKVGKYHKDLSKYYRI